MKIDRTRFIVLTGMLAGTACVVQMGPPPSTAPPAPPPHPAAPAPAPAPAPLPVGHVAPAPAPAPVAHATTTPPTPSSPPAYPKTLIIPGMHAVGPSGTTPGGYTGYDAGAPPPPPPPPPPPTACDDTVGSPPACSTIPQADQSCYPFSFPTDQCNAYRAALKPKVAWRAITCEQQLTGQQLCAAHPVYQCGDSAIHAACPDPTADTDCTNLIKACPTATWSDCRTYLAGMTPNGRAQMVTCMTNSCSAGFYACAEGLGAPTSARRR